MVPLQQCGSCRASRGLIPTSGGARRVIPHQVRGTQPLRRSPCGVLIASRHRDEPSSQWGTIGEELFTARRLRPSAAGLSFLAWEFGGSRYIIFDSAAQAKGDPTDWYISCDSVGRRPQRKRRKFLAEGSRRRKRAWPPGAPRTAPGDNPPAVDVAGSPYPFAGAVRGGNFTGGFFSRLHRGWPCERRSLHSEHPRGPLATPPRLRQPCSPLWESSFPNYTASTRRAVSVSFRHARREGGFVRGSNPISALLPFSLRSLVVLHFAGGPFKRGQTRFSASVLP